MSSMGLLSPEDSIKWQLATKRQMELNCLTEMER